MAPFPRVRPALCCELKVNPCRFLNGPLSSITYVRSATHQSNLLRTISTPQPSTGPLAPGTLGALCVSLDIVQLGFWYIEVICSDPQKLYDYCDSLIGRIDQELNFLKENAKWRDGGEGMLDAIAPRFQRTRELLCVSE